MCAPWRLLSVEVASARAVSLYPATHPAIGVSLFLENGGQRVFGADPKVFPTLIAFGDAWQLGELRIAPSHLLILGTALLLWRRGKGAADETPVYESFVAPLG